MFKKIFQPKVLAIITIISMAIYIVLNMWSGLYISGSNGLISTLIGILLSANLYVIIYLLIILLAKRKNIRVLNILLIVLLSINLVSSLLGFGNIFSIGGGLFTILNILSILPYALVLFMTIGIFFKKKIPYKLIMISAICLLIIVLGLFLYQMLSTKWLYSGNGSLSTYLLFSMLVKVFNSIGWCSFIFFMYQYGNSISKRSEKNE